MKFISSNSKVLAALWLTVVTVLTAVALYSKPVFDSSIMSLLPASKQQPIVQQATEQLSDMFAKRVVILLSSESDSSVRDAVNSLATKLKSLPDVVDVHWQLTDKSISNSQLELYPFRFSLIDPVSRQLMVNQQFEDIKTRALLNLYSPLNSGHTSIIEDPFGLYSQSKLAQQTNLNIQASHSLLKVITSQQPTYMLIMTLAEKPYSPDLQQRVLSVFEQQKQLMSESGVTMAMSGMLLHAAAGAEQANKEIMTIGIGSLFGIVIIMLLVFRQLKPLLMMAFAILVGCSVAFSATTLIFERIHVITLAFGAGLIGVSLDYALHYLCERRVMTRDRCLSKIVPGLLLGLFSSVIAYAAQAMAPFPGLQQMAVFSVIGLISAWLTVVLCFPVLTHSDLIRPLAAANQLTKLFNKLPRLELSPKLVIAALVLSVLIAIYAVANSQNIDDVRLLQTSSADLKQQENLVREQLNASSNSQFMLVQANSIEACLQKEEQLAPLLEQLVATTSISGYQALSTALPSLTKQDENSTLIQALYQQQLSSFYKQLGLADALYQQAQHSLAEAIPARLSYDSWQQLETSKAWTNSIVELADGQIATMIRFSGKIDLSAKQQLESLAATDEHIMFVDQLADISNIMRDYREQIVNWIMLAYLIVLLMLSHRYRSKVWRIILPPLLASIFTLAIIVQLEQGINIFHLMALILVLGIGLDMGIFLTETEESSHTWLAVSLSAYTSLLAFGLLALSDTPVLHHFGLTVLVGLSVVWLLVLMFRSKQQGVEVDQN